MHDKNEPGIVPEQYTGQPIDTESSIELQDIDASKLFFQTVKSRLEDVNSWERLAGEASASFQLVDKTGADVNRTVQEGDYFKIDIPGPRAKGGEGCDWVQVEEIENTSTGDMQTFGIRVRPAQNPRDASNNTSHFYSSESTSSFTVRREGTKVTAAIYDRNTKPNQDADSLLGKVRDAVVGFFGIASFSKIQWKALTEGLIKKEA